MTVAASGDDVCGRLGAFQPSHGLGSRITPRSPPPGSPLLRCAAGSTSNGAARRHVRRGSRGFVRGTHFGMVIRSRVNSQLTALSARACYDNNCAFRAEKLSCLRGLVH